MAIALLETGDQVQRQCHVPATTKTTFGRVGGAEVAVAVVVAATAATAAAVRANDITKRVSLKPES